MKPIDKYISTAREKDMTDDQIKKALVDAGWDGAQVDQLISKTKEDLPPPPPPPVSTSDHTPAKKMPPGAYAWYAFEHILMFISLAVLAISISLILNYFVDRYFPRVVVDRYDYGYSGQDSALRGYLSALIVSLPLFSFLFLDITRRTLAHPELRNHIVRKILIYLTLVVTFVMMLGYVIAAVYTFLGGNVSVNFLMHLLVTFATAGSIFAYYLSQVKGDRKLNA
jgi:hypothetical protein